MQILKTSQTCEEGTAVQKEGLHLLTIIIGDQANLQCHKNNNQTIKQMTDIQAVFGQWCVTCKLAVWVSPKAQVL